MKEFVDRLVADISVPPKRNTLRDYMLKLLLKAIKDSNLTQTAIAKQAGVGPSEISRIVNGKLEPSTEYCIRILFSLGYSVKVQEGGQIVVQKNG